jgi:dihydropteroate synthase
MHMHGTPATMQLDPLRGPEAVRAVDAFFTATRARLARAGFGPDRLWFDPGIGFGKGDAGNLALLAAIPRWAKAGQIAIGVSRKGFIGRALGIETPQDRDGPTKMLELGLSIAGARLIRTHDVTRLARLRTLLAGGG